MRGREGYRISNRDFGTIESIIRECELYLSEIPEIIEEVVLEDEERVIED